jgi:hypothetical protein
VSRASRDAIDAGIDAGIDARIAGMPVERWLDS